jgi:hypothetical protein
MEELLLAATECAWGYDVRQMKIHTAEPFVLETNPFEF